MFVLSLFEGKCENGTVKLGSPSFVHRVDFSASVGCKIDVNERRASRRTFDSILDLGDECDPLARVAAVCTF